MPATVRTRGGRYSGSEPTRKPKSDAYVGLLVISLLAQIAGAVFLYLDWSQYPETKVPSQYKAVKPSGAAPAGGQMPAVPVPGGVAGVGGNPPAGGMAGMAGVGGNPPADKAGMAGMGGMAGMAGMGGNPPPKQ